MKVTTKKVTVIQPVYIADDGREFTDEDDCIEYEYELKKKHLTFYDGGMNMCDLDSCMFVKLDTKEQVSDLRDICAYTGITVEGLIDPGLYAYFDYRREKWFNLSPVLEHFMKEE